MIQNINGQSYSLVPTTQFVTTPGVTPPAVPMTGSFANVQVPTSFANTFGMPVQTSSTAPNTGSRPSRLARSIDEFFQNNAGEGLSTSRSGRRGRTQQEQAVGRMDRLFRDMRRAGLTPTRQQEQMRAALSTARDLNGDGRVSQDEVQTQARNLFGQQAMVANNAARPATPTYSFVPMTFAQGVPVVTPQLQMPTVATQQQPATPSPAPTITPQQLVANQTPPVPGRSV